MSQAALSDRLREFFTLREAEREARALADDTRATTSHGLSLAFQKREAAETLWPRGCAAEALSLAKASLDLASSTLESFASSSEAKPAWLTRARAIADDARKRMDGVKLPELEAQVHASQEETFRALIAATLEIERVMGLGLAPPKEISATRRARGATTLGLAAFAMVTLVWWSHTPLVLHATASSQLPGNYPADNAVDDNVKTAWLLPDKQTGWIDVTLGKPRSISALRIVSGNPPFNDRAAKDAHIEAFLGNALVTATDVTFREPVGVEPDWTEVPLAAKCDRVRINVKSVHKNAGGIAEIQIR